MKPIEVEITGYARGSDGKASVDCAVVSGPQALIGREITLCVVPADLAVLHGLVRLLEKPPATHTILTDIPQ